MIAEIFATIAIVIFFLLLMEEPWVDFRKKEISLFELIFVLAVFSGPTAIALMLTWN